MESNLKIADYAINNIPFYRKYDIMPKSDEEISQDWFKTFPILEKIDVQRNRDILEGSYNRQNKIYTIVTSGTSGLPLKVDWLQSEFLKSNFYTWYLRKRWYHILPTDKYCTFHSCVNSNNETVINDVLLYENNRILSFGRYFYSEDVLSKYVQLMDEFAPKWILAQPSVLYLLADYIDRTNTKIDSIKYIELNGEFVENAVYKKIKSVFNVPIGNLYGSVEFNGIALTCPYGHMHILENNVYVENRNNNDSELIITGLVNKFMPLIRYNIGDRGEIIENCKCECGIIGKQLNLLRGRSHEIITIQNDFSLDPALFINIVNDLNVEDDIVQQFRVEIIKQKIVLHMLVQEEQKTYVELRKRYFLQKLLKFKTKNIEFDITVSTNPKKFMNGNSKFTFVKIY
ncbi:MAG: phenylacetate--CoA ligase family protein [Lachnospiraceae bacterium]|nr:phenylacetate--CoA ligase family protein [Lachnospiraceae bacterium]